MIKNEKLEMVVTELANMSEEQRQSLLTMNFNELKGLQGEELRKRLSKVQLWRLLD